MGNGNIFEPLTPQMKIKTRLFENSTDQRTKKSLVSHVSSVIQSLDDRGK